MESTFAQYGLAGVILWLMFNDIIKPMVNKFIKDTPESYKSPDEPWNPWQGKIETRVTLLESSVRDIKNHQKTQTELMQTMSNTLIRIATKMEVSDE